MYVPISISYILLVRNISVCTQFKKKNYLIYLIVDIFTKLFISLTLVINSITYILLIFIFYIINNKYTIIQ